MRFQYGRGCTIYFLWYDWVHSPSMLLVWKGSETSHHLGDKRQNYLQWAELTTMVHINYSYTRMMKKDMPRHLAPVVIKYYFIQDLHVSLKLEVARNTQFTRNTQSTRNPQITPNTQNTLNAPNTLNLQNTQITPNIQNTKTLRSLQTLRTLETFWTLRTFKHSGHSGHLKHLDHSKHSEYSKHSEHSDHSKHSKNSGRSDHSKHSKHHYQLSDDCSIREFCHYLHCYCSTGGENLRFIKCHQVVAIYDLSG